jgi:flavin reductase (DIM6/NTAB) family NADH-FMN oxidoreductase RutF
MKTVELVGSDGKKNRSSVVIGEVVGIHIDDKLIRDGMVDITKARPVARLGYMDYSVVNDVFEIMRPASPEAAIAAAKKANGAGS